MGKTHSLGVSGTDPRQQEKTTHVNNSFNSCFAQGNAGGGMCIVSISLCTRISGCKFQNCKSNSYGGGLYLENFQVSGTGCIGEENEGGESACVFDCSFTSCSITNDWGGGMFCKNVPNQFKIRSVRFISCNASTRGGGFHLEPIKQTVPADGLYCYFLFFHECKCSAATPYGHDVMYYDYYSVYLSQNNPFFECYTTNTNDTRVCYANNPSGSWIFDQTSKKDWLKRGILNRFVAVSGGGEDDLCGLDESTACRTVGVAVGFSTAQTSLVVTLMEGNHRKEVTSIDIGTKKISVIGKGKETCSIGTGALSSSSAVGTLFSVTTGHLCLLHMKIDCNSNASPSSPSVVVVSDGSGSLSLEDIVITTSKTGDYVMSSSVFVVPLSQLSMVDVEIINMNISESLFSEPDLSSPSSSSSSFSSSSLFLTSTVSGESMLANLSVKNVKLTEGDGVIVAKSVAEVETFVVRNVTIEDCECVNGSGGGIRVELETDTSKLQVVSSTTIKRCTSGKYGGGIMMHLVDGSHDFSVASVDFSGCFASLGGNYLFMNGSDSAG
ncbi:uncharacterized protein MONOS_3684 [Monocercomonoides exilis]|uniref:uncharacterized protein n=1 Tax=Monocercomonoides exilis TaxID=2049356 RepID=UPI00355A39D5|nr:hypothetical protein MONOS_3684 [Monocercomonoides exilis]|eukprot:MONOS_3684.1-p1 / transcript=MONOS_3684.1 / gene=MONOS_3684 / organism=Monocercomonoides_exilis_PA203 / gene_product=unspecified product / transcript_product=unspecified product / location=Mono_scaffold00089:55873-57680(-) / protein_length=553 / sequence_SO=supercontig / SO=protein_coding / is_pseudo=false